MKTTLSKSDIKQLNEELYQLYGIESFLSTRDSVELIDKTFVVRNKELVFFYDEKCALLPHLRTLLKQNFLKKITVDMGAIPFVIKGADIMRPGIRMTDDAIRENDIVAIIDEKFGKPLAVGRSLYSSETLREQKTGKSVMSLHYVGDEVWKWSSQ